MDKSSSWKSIAIINPTTRKTCLMQLGICLCEVVAGKKLDFPKSSKANGINPPKPIIFKHIVVSFLKHKRSQGANDEIGSLMQIGVQQQEYEILNQISIPNFKEVVEQYAA